MFVLSRNPQAARLRLPASVHTVKELAALDGVEVNIVVNLAGRNLAEGRWNEQRKREFFESRVGTTQKLVDYFQRQGVAAPHLLISGSAVGYYGNHPEPQPLTEEASCNPSFGHRLCNTWEQTALQMADLRTRVVLLRTGLVLGRDGGLMQKLKRPFSLGLGGRMGSGKQWFPWVHIEDLVDLIFFLIQHQELSGPFNGTAPNPVTNAQFTRGLGRALNRPAFMHMPAAALKLLFGEMAEETILQGQRVVPEKALKAGFGFRYPTLELALEEVVGSVS